MMFLEIAIGPDEGKQFKIDGALTIGRRSTCDIVLRGDEYVSTKHARITSHGETAQLEDLNSSNGTLHQGQPIKAPITLKKRDFFITGATQFYFKAGGNGAEHEKPGQMKTLSYHLRHQQGLRVLLNQAANFSENQRDFFIDSRHVLQALLTLNEPRWKKYLNQGGFNRVLKVLHSRLQAGLVFQESWQNHYLENQPFHGDQNTVMVSPKIESLLLKAQEMAEADYDDHPLPEHLFGAMALAEFHFLPGLLADSGFDLEAFKKKLRGTTSESARESMHKTRHFHHFPHPLVPDFELLERMTTILGRGKNPVLQGDRLSGKTSTLLLLETYLKKDMNSLAGIEDIQIFFPDLWMGFLDPAARQKKIQNLLETVKKPSVLVLIDNVHRLGALLDAETGLKQSLMAALGTAFGRVAVTVSANQHRQFWGLHENLRTGFESIALKPKDGNFVRTAVHRHLLGTTPVTGFTYTEKVIDRLIHLCSALNTNLAQPALTLTLARALNEALKLPQLERAGISKSDLHEDEKKLDQLIFFALTNLDRYAGIS